MGAQPEPLIENRTFHEIEVGDTVTLERTLGWRDVELFAVMSGDINPAHVDEEYARTDRFHGIVAHGMWGASLISALLGTRSPGPERSTSSKRSGFAIRSRSGTRSRSRSSSHRRTRHAIE